MHSSVAQTEPCIELFCVSERRTATTDFLFAADDMHHIRLHYCRVIHLMNKLYMYECIEHWLYILELRKQYIKEPDSHILERTRTFKLKPVGRFSTICNG